MNVPPEAYVTVQEDRLLTFLEDCFRKAGLDEAHARTLSRLLVNSDLRGVRSHGARQANYYCQALVEGSVNARPNIRAVHETATSVVLDGDGALGYLPMMRATERAIAKAKDVGIGMGIVRHIGHYGSAGHYARMCMEEGCIGFSLQGYRNGGRTPDAENKPSIARSGNPPICFAIPGGEGPPVVVDAGADVFGAYYDSSYDDLFERVPAAYFKSIGYVAVSHLVGGALTGFGLPEWKENRSRWSGASTGGMVLAIHVESVLPFETFTDEVDHYVNYMQTTHTPVPGTDRALLPGALEEERMQLHRKEGIRFGEAEQQSVRRAGERFGISVPWDE